MARRRRWWNVLRLASPLGQASSSVELAPGLDLRRAIAQLPYRDRELLHLYYVLDLPAAEVAVTLGIGIGAVKSRLHRLTNRLRPRLETAEVSR
jgi:RNA polymerase sigma-70 factor (ECF subfamily)